jgi:hypothetical protein
MWTSHNRERTVFTVPRLPTTIMKRIPLSLLAGLLTATMLFTSAVGQEQNTKPTPAKETESLKLEVESLKKENEALRRENQQIRKLLAERVAERPPATPAPAASAAPATAPSAQAAPAVAVPQAGASRALGYWLTSSSSKRHNSTCRFYGTSKGRACGPNDGVACRICGG